MSDILLMGSSSEQRAVLRVGSVFLAIKPPPVASPPFPLHLQQMIILKSVKAGNKQNALQIEMRDVAPAVHSNWSAQIDKLLSGVSAGRADPERLFVRSVPRHILSTAHHLVVPNTPLVTAEVDWRFYPLL